MANVIVVLGFLLVCALGWIIRRERQYRAREEEVAGYSQAWAVHEQELLGHVQKMRRELMASYKVQESLTQQLTDLQAWREKVLRQASQQQGSSGN